MTWHPELQILISFSALSILSYSTKPRIESFQVQTHVHKDAVSQGAPFLCLSYHSIPWLQIYLAVDMQRQAVKTPCENEYL